VSGDERVGGVLTQSDVVHVIHGNLAALGDVGAAAIGALFPAAVAGWCSALAGWKGRDGALDRDLRRAHLGADSKVACELGRAPGPTSTLTLEDCCSSWSWHAMLGGGERRLHPLPPVSPTNRRDVSPHDCCTYPHEQAALSLYLPPPPFARALTPCCLMA
jgi:hypothetical protein